MRAPETIKYQGQLYRQAAPVLAADDAIEVVCEKLGLDPFKAKGSDACRAAAAGLVRTIKSLYHIKG